MTSKTSSAAGPGPHMRHYLELDGIRGLAAMAVFVHHLFFAAIPSRQLWSSAWRVPFALFDLGAYGVDLFFVLSGFLITSLLLKDRESPYFYRDFYWKRALRILPMYVITLIIIGCLLRQSRGYILLSIFFIANFGVWFRVATGGALWSLAIEEQFYLLWPSLVRRCSVRVLIRCATIIWVTSVVLRFAVAVYGKHDFYLTPLRGDGLAAGALLACWNTELKTDVASAKGEAWLLASCSIVGALLIGISFAQQTSLSQPIAEAMTLTGAVVMSVAFVGMTIRKIGAVWLGWLRWPPLLFMGAISYAFYLLHLYVLTVYVKFAGDPAIGDVRACLVRGAIVFTVTVALCVVTRYCIELPAISLRRFVLARPTPPPESAMPLHASSSD